jgi:hypothetical protein
MVSWEKRGCGHGMGFGTKKTFQGFVTGKSISRSGDPRILGWEGQRSENVLNVGDLVGSKGVSCDGSKYRAEDL